MRIMSASSAPSDFCKLTTVDKPPYPAPKTSIVFLFTKIETTFIFHCTGTDISGITEDIHSPGLCKFKKTSYTL